jgi:hypothetical protein
VLAPLARSLGTGGATGLGSIVYALTVISKCLHDRDLFADARAAANLFTDDLIAADKQLDVLGGSAGAILCLLRLYRDSQSTDVLRRAIKCGEHLLAQNRIGPASKQELKERITAAPCSARSGAASGTYWVPRSVPLLPSWSRVTSSGIGSNAKPADSSSD